MPLPRSSAAVPYRNRAFLKRLRKRYKKGRLVILPFHDPAVMKAYPRSHPDIVRILTIP